MTDLRPRVRRSRSSDGNRVVEIWRAAVDATHHFLDPDDRAAIDAEVAAFLPNCPLWLAVDANDHPLAFLLLETSHVAALFVDPIVAGRGIGRSLIAHASTLHGGLSVDVNEQNTGACSFYRRLGFVVTGRSPRDDQGRPYPLLQLRRD